MTRSLLRYLFPGAWLLVLWSLASGVAAAEPAPEAAPGSPEAEVAVIVPGPELGAEFKCSEPGSDDNAWIDKVQRGLYKGVCGTAFWFDGLFGNPRFDQDSDQTFGRLGLFENYDRRDAFDTRIRLRARVQLPAMKERLRLTLGRGEEQAVLEERPADSTSPLPTTFQDVKDDAWLLGLGYSKQSGFEQGFDFGIGIRLNTPVDPYVKGTYRRNFVFNEDTMLRFRETPFWRDSRGFGATTQVALDHLATDTVLLRWNNNATIAEDTDGVEWGTGFTAYQSLKQRRAISYSALLRIETAADVPIQNYGFEARYRQSVFRKWLFMELSTSLTWPREDLTEEREINPGVGLGFEMYFGPVADIDLR